MSLRSRALYVDDIRESCDAWSGLETNPAADMTWQQDYQRALPKRLKRKSNRLRNACLCLVGLWVAGVLWFLVGFLKKRNSAASTVGVQESGTKETPSLRAGARLQPEPPAVEGLDPQPASEGSNELSDGGSSRGQESSAQQHPWGGSGAGSGDTDNGATDRLASNQADGIDVHNDMSGEGDGGEGHGNDDASGAGGSGTYGGSVRRVLTHANNEIHHNSSSLDADSKLTVATTTAAARLPLSPLPRVRMDSVSFPALGPEKRTHSRSAANTAAATGAKSAAPSVNGTTKGSDTYNAADNSDAPSGPAQHSAAGQVSSEAGGWSNALLQKAYVAVQKQFPLCGAKMRWYCEQEGVSDQCADGDVSTLDAMQAKVVAEGLAAAASQAVHDQRVAAAAAAAKARAANRQIAALRAASSGGGLVALSTTAAATNTAPAASAGTGTELGSGGGASSNASTTTTAGTGDRASVVPKTALLPLTHLQANDLQQKELFANASSQEGANSLSTHHSWGPSESVGSPRLQPQRHTPLSNANLNNKGHGEGPQPDPEPSSERTSVRSVKTATTGGSHGGHAHGGAHEGAGPALACPSVESFSLGRVWASAHRWEESRRRNEEVPYWRQKLIAAGQRAAAALQPEVAQWWPSPPLEHREMHEQKEHEKVTAKQEEASTNRANRDNAGAMHWFDSSRQLRGLSFGSAGDSSREAREEEDEKEEDLRFDAAATTEAPPISLLIVVLTYPRPGDPPFLLDTVDALETAIADLSSASLSSPSPAEELAHVGVVVMNSAAPGHMHARFAEAKKRNKERGGAVQTKIAFFNNPFLAEQPEPEDYIMGPVARQISTQSWHVAAGLSTAAALARVASPSHVALQQPPSSSSSSSASSSSLPADAGAAAAASSATTSPEYIMLVEDDMRLCGGALPVLLADIRAAAAASTTTTASTSSSAVAASHDPSSSSPPRPSPPRSPFNALLVSYGLNGFVLRATGIAPPPPPPQAPSVDKSIAAAALPFGSFSSNDSTATVSRGNVNGDEAKSTSSSKSSTPGAVSSENREGGGSKVGYLLDFLLENRSPAGCETCVTPPDLAAYEWAGLHQYPPYQMDPTYRASPNGAYTRSTNLFHHLGAHASTFEDRSFEVPDQYRCGGPLQFSNDQRLGVHVLNRHWNASWNRLAAESIENDVSNAHLGAHNMTSSASMTSSRTTSSSSSSRVDVVTLGRGLGGTTAARAAAHAAINSAVHQSRGAGGGGGSAAAAVGAAAAAAASIEGASSKESTAVEEPVNGAVSLLRKAKERGAARHKSSVTHRHD